MLVKKTICDRCKRDVDSNENGSSFDLPDSGEQDLCVDCLGLLYKFMEGNSVPSVKAQLKGQM